MSRLLARGAECWATVGAEAKQGAIPRLAVAANRRASELVAPLARRVVRLIAASEVVPADETPMPVQDDRKRPYIWTLVAGTLVACRFSMTRSGDVVDTGKATPSRCVVRDRGSVQQADGVLALVAADAAELFEDASLLRSYAQSANLFSHSVGKAPRLAQGASRAPRDGGRPPALP